MAGCRWRRRGSGTAGRFKVGVGCNSSGRNLAGSPIFA